ncbi:membrane protein of unknown function [Micropruina glycogenica]|uniref:Uncharacterized protein n=2 Tax=Micropruina glycogenica TaxID=75385 RepID=A0A2N9JHS0_9ACTN|nr:membrane protein of unknown function [Micropruina glycogenica]
MSPLSGWQWSAKPSRASRVRCLIWCLVGTRYLLVMVVTVGLDSLHRRPFPPTRVQANVVVRWTSLSASLITAVVGLVAAFMILIGTTFATTDVTVTGRRDRWRVMMHSVLTFFCNSSILVLAVSSLTG